MKITIGHTAYEGKNAYAVAANKTQAVRILMERGCTRSAARDATAKAATGDFATVCTKTNEVIEVKAAA